MLLKNGLNDKQNVNFQITDLLNFENDDSSNKYNGEIETSDEEFVENHRSRNYNTLQEESNYHSQDEEESHNNSEFIL